MATYGFYGSRGMELKKHAAIVARRMHPNCVLKSVKMSAENLFLKGKDQYDKLGGLCSATGDTNCIEINGYISQFLATINVISAADVCFHVDNTTYHCILFQMMLSEATKDSFALSLQQTNNVLFSHTGT